MHEVTLRIEPGGPYAAPTAGTDAAVELWCNDHCDLLAVRNDREGQVRAAIQGLVGIRDQLVDDGRMLVITERCLKAERRTVERHLERHSCLLVPPLRYAEGAKLCRVVGLDVEDLAGVYRDLQEEAAVEVESKRRVTTPTVEHPLVTLESVLPRLTERQREVLLLAYDRGYYAIPRETTTTAIADGLGVERRTAEDHLRRAENKLVDALAEHLRSAPKG